MQMATVATVEACTPRACTVADVTVCWMMLDPQVLYQNLRVARKSVRKRCEQFCGRHGVRASRAHINHMCTRPMQFTREINCKRSCLQSETCNESHPARAVQTSQISHLLDPTSQLRQTMQNPNFNATSQGSNEQHPRRGQRVPTASQLSHKLTSSPTFFSFEQCIDGQLGGVQKGCLDTLFALSWNVSAHSRTLFEPLCRV